MEFFGLVQMVRMVILFGLLKNSSRRLSVGFGGLGFIVFFGGLGLIIGCGVLVWRSRWFVSS